MEKYTQIRVTVEVRDTFKKIAKERGMTMYGLLGQLVKQLKKEGEADESK